jgi:hypothetical protein
MDTINKSTPCSGAASVPFATLFVPAPDQQEWVDHLKNGFVGDIVACLSITMAVTRSSAADGTMVRCKTCVAVCEDICYY